METVLLSMVGFAVVLLALGVRVVFGRRPSRGSGGGDAAARAIQQNVYRLLGERRATEWGCYY